MQDFGGLLNRELLSQGFLAPEPLKRPSPKPKALIMSRTGSGRFLKQKKKQNREPGGGLLDSLNQGSVLRSKWRLKVQAPFTPPEGEPT